VIVVLNPCLTLNIARGGTHDGSHIAFAQIILRAPIGCFTVLLFISLSSVIGTLGITFVRLRLVPLHEMYPWTVISSQRAKRESSRKFHPYDHVLQSAISEG